MGDARVVFLLKNFNSNFRPQKRCEFFLYPLISILGLEWGKDFQEGVRVGFDVFVNKDCFLLINNADMHTLSMKIGTTIGIDVFWYKISSCPPFFM